jgi:hypothetical protein
MTTWFATERRTVPMVVVTTALLLFLSFLFFEERPGVASVG